MILLKAVINLPSTKVTVTNIIKTLKSLNISLKVKQKMQSPETELVMVGLGLVLTIEFELADLKISQDEARVGDCVGDWVGELKLSLTPPN